MRLAKSSRTLLPLALSAVLATCAWAQEHPNIQPNAVRDQLMKPATGQSQPPASSQSETSVPAGAKHSNAAKAKSPAKNGAKSPAGVKGPAVASANSAEPAVEKLDVEKPGTRRDPFDTLLAKAREGNGTPANLPPGKAGLQVDSLRIDGIVHGPNGMIAIVSNPQMRVYFLRDGDKLYDGSVDQITLEAVSFQQIGKDAFGKPLERVVTKRLYPSPGE